VAPFLGGQASTFEIGGGRLERGYHHLFVSDTAITELIHELGLGESLAWLESKVGIYHSGRIWDFATPSDLLKFRPLTFAQRIRKLAQLPPTGLLTGNHDLPVNAAKASTMDMYHTLDVPDIWVALDYELRRISARRGDVIVGAAPYPIRARLVGDVSRRGLTIAEQAAELETGLLSVGVESQGLLQRLDRF